MEPTEWSWWLLVKASVIILGFYTLICFGLGETRVRWFQWVAAIILGIFVINSALEQRQAEEHQRWIMGRQEQLFLQQDLNPIMLEDHEHRLQVLERRLIGPATRRESSGVGR